MSRLPTRLKRGIADDTGSAALETAILAPPLLALLALAVIGMRIEVAGGAIEGAAHAGARAGSLARNSSEAYAAAVSTARNSLTQQGLHCEPNIAVDTTAFGATPGEAGFVQVTISCTVAFADVAVAGLPGSRRITATFMSPVDVYRSRS